MKPNKDVVNIKILQELEPQIKVLLKDVSVWKSLDVDYYPPRVERLYTVYNGFRVHLHIIHHTEEACLYHKHRWPAVFKQIRGSYYMGVTYCEGEISSQEAHLLPTLAKFLISEGCYYEMTQTNSLHFVQPSNSFLIDGQPVSLSIMVTKDGEMYDEAVFRKEALDRKLNVLSLEKMEKYLQIFDFEMSK